MNEEIMNNEEIMENEVTETTEVQMYDMPAETSGGIIGKVIKGLVVGVIGCGIAYGVTHKEELKKRRNEKKAKQLEEAGYVVQRPEEAEVFEEDVFEEEVILEEEETPEE